MAKPDKKRRLFDELMEAVEDISQWREGKIPLKAVPWNHRPSKQIKAEEITANIKCMRIYL